MGAATSKVLLDLGGRPLLDHSLEVLQKWGRADRLIIVARPRDREAVEDSVGRRPWINDRSTVVEGGSERRDSVLAGLRVLEEAGGVQTVLIHDAARPFASAALFDRVCAQASKSGAAAPGVEIRDTLRRQSEDGRLITVSREGLWAIQTPQGFELSLLLRAHRSQPNRAATDDAVLVESLGHRVDLVPGESLNFKITSPDDLRLAQALLATWKGGATMWGRVRVGIGHDSHRLAEPGPLRLGGVDLDASFHAVGHSDGDALLHAIADAMLGALALGDIGQLFPDTDASHQGQDSATILEHVHRLVIDRGFRPQHVDTIIHLEGPRLWKTRSRMQQRIAQILEIGPEQVSIKAKTAEGVGEIGAGRLIAVDALVQLESLLVPTDPMPQPNPP